MTQELPEGTVTVLFTDVEGSTDLTTRLGDEAAREVLRASDELVRQQVARHRGQEVKHTGDGLMVAFTSARRAVACAIDIQRALQRRGRREPERAVRVRIGLNTGEVIREEEDLFGATVNAAKRIADHAGAGQILLSETARGLLGAGTTVQLEDRGEVQLKGFPEAVHLFGVSWEEEAVGPAGLRLPERTPFVGRKSERADLRRLLGQAISGQGALVMIGGEPGVGKTRLAEELLLEGREREVLALTGHCYEMEGAPPYIPFVEILQATVRLVQPEALRDVLGESAPEVAKLLPDLRRLFPDIPPPLEMPPEQERFYLFNSVREFIDRASRVQPLLLVLEDLHWGDDATLLLLQHIAQQLNQMPVLILGTYRDVELDAARPLARALDELVRQRLGQRLALKRLAEADTGAMLHALSGQEPPDPLVRVVYSETEGNPFFVEEVYQHLSEEGKLFDAQGRWRSDTTVGELEVPESVRLAISRRLQRVGEDCRRVLTTAGVIGRAFSFELLEALGEVEVDALLDAVDEAERAHLISSKSDGPEARFSFAHELIRQTLLSGLSLPRRQRLHLRVAEGMERVYADALEGQAAELAYHLYQAGSAADQEKTTHYLILAGDRALDAAASEDALRHYENAVSLMQSDDRQGQADLFKKKGMALRSLGRWGEALGDWRSALDTYEQLGDSEAMARLAGEMISALSWSASWEEAESICQRALASLGDQVSAARAQLLGSYGSNVGLSGDYDLGLAELDRALAVAEQAGDKRTLGGVLFGKSSVHIWHMEPQETLDAGLRAIELLHSAGDAWNLIDCMWQTSYSMLYTGRLDEVRQLGVQASSLAQRVGHLAALMVVRRGTKAADFMATGDLDGFERAAREDFDVCRTTNMPWVSQSHTWLGMSHFWRGQWEQAVADFEEAATLEPPGFLMGLDCGALLIGKAYLGDRATALEILDSRGDNLARPGRANTVGRWSMLLSAVEGLAVLGEREQTWKLYPLVQEAVDTGTIVLWWARLLQAAAGMAAAAGQRWREAEEHYQTALRQAHEVPVVIGQPEVRRWYARMLIDRNAPGDRDKARELLTEAVAMYRQIGMPKHVEMAEAMLREL